ncbi:MAG TPA: DSD1 family PLP-dependent enzyme [Armatimonadota bacterium]|jgi:D-serine deaminase-like pyridoxal phosphate-dependent protein
MYNTSLIGRDKFEADTPALLLDIRAVESNVRKMSSFFEGRECRLRPHCKTHKLPLIARMQMEGGAIGITCSKIREAEVMMAAGIQSVLIANEIVDPGKIRRLVNLTRYGEIIVCVDNFDNAAAISDCAGSAGTKMNVLVEINAGINRCGVAAGEPTVDFVRRISSLDGLVFRGLMGYEGGVFIDDPAEKERICRESNARLVDTANMVREDGHPVEIVSAGGSNTYAQSGIYPGITEVQVGSYVTMDIHNREFNIDFEQAVSVLATVISRPEPGRAVIDAGKKCLSTDNGLPEIMRGGTSLFALNEEHGHVRIENPSDELKVGDKLLLIPSHGCTTIPYFDDYVIVRDDIIESITEIPARQSS